MLLVTNVAVPVKPVKLRFFALNEVTAVKDTVSDPAEILSVAPTVPAAAFAHEIARVPVDPAYVQSTTEVSTFKVRFVAVA